MATRNLPKLFTNEADFGMWKEMVWELSLRHRFHEGAMEGGMEQRTDGADQNRCKKCFIGCENMVCGALGTVQRLVRFVREQR